MKSLAPKWADKLRGRFIVFDGPDGGGKTTQFHRFAAWAREVGVTVTEVREPGGTEIGEQVRKILLDPTNQEDIDVRCEMLLFMASRAQLVAQRIGPALAQGQLVLADRFISSTLAYQGAAGGLPTADILAVGHIAVRQCWPDLVVIFDVDSQTSAARLAGRGKPVKTVKVEGPTLFTDRIEMKGEDFHRAVRQGYLAQAKADPERYVVIDARGDAEAVFVAILKAMEEWLEKK